MEKDLEYVLGINRHHNGSICLLKDGEILFHIEEERLSRYKTDNVPLLCLTKIRDYTDRIDITGSVGFHDLVNLNEAHRKALSVYDALLFKVLKEKDYPRHDSYFKGHHLCHASISFYNSGFTDAVCVVVDGNGSTLGNFVETESIFNANYPADFRCLYKRGYSETLSYDNEMVDTSDRISVGHIFEALCIHYGFEWHEAGKVMGLSAYGKPNTNLPKILIDGRANPEMFNGRKFIYEYEKTFQNMADIAYAAQKECQEYVTSLILKAIDLSKNKNVCLSGGFFLNCVANYEYLKHLPEGTNLYVEPISGDAGLSIGVAKHIWHNKTKDNTIRKQTSLYYGSEPNLNIPENVNSKKVTPKDVAELLRDGKIIAMFQGRCEAGPRALGNRSILFNPSIKDGKDIINKVKKRESFRPFAGTILLEKVHEWFDMRGLKESPFMMFAVNCLEDKKDKIPSIVHVDGTCRIQTLSFEQNVCYYNLIKAFEDLTGIPILFNTSFNMAGDPLVETLEEAIHTLNNTEIDYLYIPEKELLIF